MKKEDIEAIINKPTEDEISAAKLILDFNNIRNKYTFSDDVYKATYAGICRRLEKMEDYLRTLNKTMK